LENYKFGRMYPNSEAPQIYGTNLDAIWKTVSFKLKNLDMKNLHGLPKIFRHCRIDDARIQEDVDSDSIDKFRWKRKSTF